MKINSMFKLSTQIMQSKKLLFGAAALVPGWGRCWAQKSMTQVISIPWPVEQDFVNLVDPIRSWLEKNIGRQGSDWDWKLVDSDTIEIRARPEYSQQLTWLALQWS